MPKVQRVSKAQAEAVLAEVRRVFAVYIGEGDRGPQLQESFEWGAGLAPWAVVWEEGPYDWAHLATSGDIDEELSSIVDHVVWAKAIKQPAGVHCEPYTSWALGIYPA
jgi:hypothetical protein